MPIDAVVVVVPSRDEQQHLEGCCAALLDAVHAAQAAHPALLVHVVVVLDATTDASADVVRRFPFTVVTIDAGSVGVARASGVRWALQELPTVPTELIWVATTDADSRVPPNWLTHQLASAEEYGAVFGIVEVDDWSERGVGVAGAWRRAYTPRTGHRHVHGANLGVRADHYLAAGGFPPAGLHEDVELANRLQVEVPVLWSSEHAVTTSARRDNRVDGGFALFLDDLDQLGLSTGPGTELSA